ncbi:MAG TPA: DNA polymerase III subunit gamma/tau [Pirellulales bacterium]
MNDASAAGHGEKAEKKANYVVVARRYRPQSFADLVGQDQVVRALSNAITQDRVAHAYLFTGARGVGKTSSARILAKCLNCERGTSPSPCNECPTCKAISSGDDMDVIEIDAASNRGIDEMRDLRQNAGIRPSQSRYKIYIIDEVHMLTREAFNALLKTLEEPPEHVKFILCTTEAEKIPITILSRCQRFDFSTVDTPNIAERLEQIVAREGAQIHHEAALALARRAGGSMRDSQSLLEQLLAFGGKTIQTADVHAMLGTADDVRVCAIVSAVVEGRADIVFAEVDAAMREGVDPGQLLDQLLGFFRDLMVIASGASADLCLFVTPEQRPALAAAGQRLGLETTLAIQHILAETKSRLRYSTQGRILVELALVRASQLENLDDLKRLAAELRGQLPASGVRSGPAVTVSTAPGNYAPSRPALPSAGQAPSGTPVTRPAPPANLSAPSNYSASSSASAPAPAPKKNFSEPDSAPVGVSVVVASPPAAAAPSAYGSSNAAANGSEPDLSYGDARAIWSQIVSKLSDMTADYASHATAVFLRPPSKLVVHFPPDYAFHKKFLERSDKLQPVQKAASEVVGRNVAIEFKLGDGSDVPAEPPAGIARGSASDSSSANLELSAAGSQSVAASAPYTGPSLAEEAAAFAKAQAAAKANGSQVAAASYGAASQGTNGAQHANGSHGANGSSGHNGTNGSHYPPDSARIVPAASDPEPPRPTAPARMTQGPRPSDPIAERAVQENPMFKIAVEKFGAKLLKAEAPPPLPPDANGAQSA